MERGFTLLELLLVLGILAVSLSWVGPRFFRLYEHLRQEEDVRLFYLKMYQLKRQAFLQGRSFIIEGGEAGGLVLREGDKEPIPLNLRGLQLSLSKPISFFSNGATDGGKIWIRAADMVFLITIRPISGDMQLSRIR